MKGSKKWLRKMKDVGSKVLREMLWLYRGPIIIGTYTMFAPTVPWGPYVVFGITLAICVYKALHS